MGLTVKRRCFYENLSYMNLWNGLEDDTYLDFCTDEKGYLFVLSYHGSGNQVSDYHVDIYNPDGSFLVRTPDSRLQPEAPQYINAGRLESDEFRNLYTLNFEKITGSNGKTEPSVSRWVPTSPLFTLEKDAQQELEGGNLGKLRERFKPHGITLTASARLVKQDDRYVIEDDQEVEAALWYLISFIVWMSTMSTCLSGKGGYMEKKQVVVSEGNPLILATGGTYGFDTITVMPGGRIRIAGKTGEC